MADDDEIWNQVNDIHNQEWNRMDNEFTNAGYREGITSGKENSLQEGFDEGFALTGVPLGRDVGRLRGITSACIYFLRLSSPAPDHPALSELLDILQCLNQLRFKDLVSPDLQAEEHMQEHIQSEGDSSDRLLARTADKEKRNLAVNSLEDCRIRLRGVSEQIGLQVVIP